MRQDLPSLKSTQRQAGQTQFGAPAVASPFPTLVEAVWGLFHVPITLCPAEFEVLTNFEHGMSMWGFGSFSSAAGLIAHIG